MLAVIHRPTVARLSARTIVSMISRVVAVCAMNLCAMFAAPRTLHAQVTAPRPAGTNTLVGIVTDTLNVPIADIEVFITESRRRTRTRADGLFRFDSLPFGTFTVIARGVGFVGNSFKATVGAKPLSVAIQLIRLERVLPAIITTANRGGLSGIIGDTAYQPLPNVAVGILGGEGSTRTDSLGKFFIPLKPGGYLIKLERPGYERQVLSATIPPTEGRMITAWMRLKSGATNMAAAIALFNMHERLVREGGIAMKTYTHDELVARGLNDLFAVARRSANGTVVDDCQVSVSGESSVPIWALTADDVEFVEVYQEHRGVGSGKARGVTSISGNSTKFKTNTIALRPGVQQSCGNLAILVWPRR